MGITLLVYYGHCPSHILWALPSLLIGHSPSLYGYCLYWMISFGHSPSHSFTFHYRDAITFLITRIFWNPGFFYMFTHYFNNRRMVLYILTGYRVLGIVCLDQLYGACHTHISYHDSRLKLNYFLWISGENEFMLTL